MFGLFKSPSAAESAAETLYGAVVRQARQPYFYLDLGVPDTPDGRYDMVMIHAFLVLHRLKRDQAETESTAQALFDFMFADMDLNLREMGVGDIGVAHRIKDMAKAFYGRIAAYEAGLAGDAGALDAALARNVYRAVETDPERVAALAAYVRQQADVLAGQATAELLAGKVAFGAVPASDGGSPR